MLSFNSDISNTVGRMGLEDDNEWSVNKYWEGDDPFESTVPPSTSVTKAAEI
jgi:hypothetical protein